MTAHDLICALKDYAIELGRVPTRDEMDKRVRGFRTVLKNNFGTYSALIQAADMQPERIRSRLTNRIFERDIGAVLENYEPREIVKPPIYKRTLCIGDAHLPFIDKRALDFVYEFTAKNKPEIIIQLGDLYDMFGASKFPKSLNIYRPEEEMAHARMHAETMWKTLRSIAPDAKCIQLKGNHDIRPIKRALESLPAMEHVVEKYLNELMTFEGVELITDPRQEYIIDGIQFIHGYRSQLGSHRDYALMNTVCAHTHKGGVVFRRFRGQTFWELNCGFIADAESKALGYTPQKIHDCTPGLGWIDEYGPRFIPVT